MTINQHSIIKKGLLALILIFLWLVILQDLFGLKQVRPLFGYYVKPQDTIFTWTNWKLGKFQKTREEYLQEEFCLREDYVRLNNTIQYKLFNSTRVKWIVFGENGHLLTYSQIQSYLGTDSISQNDANRKAFYLAAVEDTLNKLGKQLYTTIPPNKLEVFPEHIPNSFPKKVHLNNYERFRTAFKNNKVNFIDFIEYVKKLKATGTTSLFPKNGSHWNYYGSALSMKYFLSRINQSQMFKVGNLVITDSFYSKEHNGDPDIYASLNLIDKTVDDTTLYPVLHIDSVNSKKPRTIFITDSYFDGWIDFGIYDLLDSVTYYFYNDRIINKDRTEEKRKFSTTELLQHYDIFVIMCNQANLPEFCWGFAEKMYFHFYPLAPNRAYYDVEFRNKVYEKINQIKLDESRYNRITEMAKNSKQKVIERCYEEALIELHNEIYLAKKTNGI